ncbi:MAG: hypothetical protein IT367_20475 [Candidatus Hydrogenedentes bacterium]|nr:hypothetical protein [Candidatus Hydrogenedentota bacterium]
MAAEGGVVDRRVDSVSDSPSKPGLKDRVLTKVGKEIGEKIDVAMDAPATEFINGQPVLISKAAKKGAVSLIKVLLGVASGLGFASVSVDHDTLIHFTDQINVAWASGAVVVAFVVGFWRAGVNLWKMREGIKENGLQVSAKGGSIVFYRKPKAGGNWEAFDPAGVTTS